MARRAPRILKEQIVYEIRYFCDRCKVYVTHDELKNYDCPHCIGQRLRYAEKVIKE